MTSTHGQDVSNSDTLIDFSSLPVPSTMASSNAKASETTPLLSSSASSSTLTTYTPDENGSREIIYKKEDVDTITIFFQECRTIGAFAVPVFGSQILEYSLVFVSVFTLGHLSTTALAAISIATMTTGVTGLSVIHGFCSALDTLLPPAWTSEQPGMMRVWLMRVAVGVAVQIMMIWTLWYHAEGILLGLRQDPEVARLAAQYLKVECIGLPAFAVSTIMRRWFSAQELFSIPTKLILIISPINLLLNYTLVLGLPIKPFDSWRLGFIGAPISTATCQWALMFMNLVYAYMWVSRRGWYGVPPSDDISEGEDDPTIKSIPDDTPTKPSAVGYGKGKGWYGWNFEEAFDKEGLRTVTKLGLSGIGQLATEWWAWEVLVLAASQLGPTSLAAQSALSTTAAMMFQVALGVALAAPVRIGNLLGEKNARRAGIAANAALVLTLGTSFSTSLLLLTFRKKWGTMFIDDPAVTSLIASILPIIALFQIVDGNAAVTAGIMRAKGQQFVGAMMNMAGYWMVALPIGGWLAFKEGWGLKGLWVGFTICLVFTSVVGTVLALITDWEWEVRKVTERMEQEERRTSGETEDESIVRR